MGIIREALFNLFRRPFTELYPYEKKKAFPRYRGNIIYYPEKCIGCRMCERNCPTGAIKVHRKGKIKFKMAICIYCGNCKDVCPVAAIDYSSEYEWARKKKRDIKNIESK